MLSMDLCPGVGRWRSSLQRRRSEEVFTCALLLMCIPRGWGLSEELSIKGSQTEQLMLNRLCVWPVTVRCKRYVGKDFKKNVQWFVQQVQTAGWEVWHQIKKKTNSKNTKDVGYWCDILWKKTDFSSQTQTGSVYLSADLMTDRRAC